MIFISYFLKHFFTLGIEILANIELLFRARLIVLYFPFFFLYNFCHFCVLEAENVIKIPLVDVDILVLFLRLWLFQ